MILEKDKKINEIYYRINHPRSICRYVEVDKLKLFQIIVSIDDPAYNFKDFIFPYDEWDDYDYLENVNKKEIIINIFESKI